jgi:hypothetical protein
MGCWKFAEGRRFRSSGKSEQNGDGEWKGKRGERGFGKGEGGWGFYFIEVIVIKYYLLLNMKRCNFF